MAKHLKNSNVVHFQFKLIKITKSGYKEKLHLTFYLLIFFKSLFLYMLILVYIKV